MLKGIPWFLPLLTRKGRSVACLVLMRTEAHKEDPGSDLHFKAEEQVVGILLLKFQSRDTPGCDSILGYSPEEWSGGQKSTLDPSFQNLCLGQRSHNTHHSHLPHMVFSASDNISLISISNLYILNKCFCYQLKLFHISIVILGVYFY